MVHDLEDWQQHLVYGDGDIYQRMTEAFRIKNNLDDDHIEPQWDVIQEEFEELEEVIGYYTDSLKQGKFEGSKELAEEMVDTIYTIHLMANLLSIDLNKAFKEKAAYNLQKSGERDESGKVVDDVDG